MKTTILVVSHVKKDQSFLFRKKPDGSLPYKETWYGFGAELHSANQNPDEAIIALVKQQTGVDIVVTEHLWWDTETKPNNDGELTFFVYLHTIAEYLGGELLPAAGIEKLQWIEQENLKDYDIVPPSRAFLARYLY